MFTLLVAEWGEDSVLPVLQVAQQALGKQHCGHGHVDYPTSVQTAGLSVHPAKGILNITMKGREKRYKQIN